MERAELVFVSGFGAEVHVDTQQEKHALQISFGHRNMKEIVPFVVKLKAITKTRLINNVF